MLLCALVQVGIERNNWQQVFEEIMRTGEALMVTSEEFAISLRILHDARTKTVPLFTPAEVFVKELNTPNSTWTLIWENGVNVCARAFPGNSLWQSLSAVGEERADK